MARLFFCAVCAAAAVAVFLGLATVVAAAEKPGPDEATFPMREISAFEKSDIPSSPYRLNRGAQVECSTEPDKAVKAYPKLNSKRPLYGKVKFDQRQPGGTGIEFHFVLDESGETPADQEKQEQKKAPEKKPEPSLLQSLINKLTGSAEKDQAAQKPEEKKPKLSRYDRLHFDVNRDLDLTNDPVLKPLKDPPWQALPPWPLKERMAFEYVDVGIDYGPGLGVRPFRVLPWFGASEHEKQTYNHMFFVATAARQGRIRIGTREYGALLAQAFGITGRFDRPFTALYLKPVGEQADGSSDGFDSNMLMTTHQIGGGLYMTAATPLGDKLTVKRYRGDFGLFAVGPGGRKIKDIAMQGSFRSETSAIGTSPDHNRADGKEHKVRECKLPVGDYVPSYLTIDYGRLRIGLSDNYHSEGRPRDMDRRRDYGIKIRKDKPFVLDFSAKPVVLFANPPKDKTFKPGDEVKIAAVLVDPSLDIMIRDLDDTKRKKKVTTKFDDGKESSYEQDLSLDPVVTITNASGKKVSEGPMPFG
jgi:hypothetical protein